MFIQYFHTFTWFFFALYGFIFSKNWFDPYYIYINLITLLSWTLFKDECIISLVFKWQIDPTYKMGTNTEPSDLLYLFGKEHYHFMKIIQKILIFLKSVSLYIVLQRMHYPYSLQFSSLYLFYSIVKINSTLYRGIYFLLFMFIFFNLKSNLHY